MLPCTVNTPFEMVAFDFEEGDGTIAVKLLVGLTGFEEEADNANKETGKRARRSGVLEGRVEDIGENGDKEGLEVTIKLVREAVNAWS